MPQSVNNLNLDLNKPPTSTNNNTKSFKPHPETSTTTTNNNNTKSFKPHSETSTTTTNNNNTKSFKPHPETSSIMNNGFLLTPPTPVSLPTSPDQSSTKPDHLPVPERRGCPPHITISAPDSQDVTDFRLDELDLSSASPDSAPSPDSSPSRPSPTDEKHEVHSGRLYLLRNLGYGTTPTNPKSPTSPPVTSFLPQSTSVTSSDSSPPDSPDSAPFRRAVWVRVYRCGLEHFAVITRDACMLPGIYVNVRRCRLVPGLTLGQFVLSAADSGHLLEFETPDLGCLSQWLDAFQSQSPPTSPSRQSGSCSPRPRSPLIQPTLSEIVEEED